MMSVRNNDELAEYKTNLLQWTVVQAEDIVAWKCFLEVRN